ncbi:hypothetical protein VNI00_000200 [Paramarasmius palmivorus]|uniref:Peptidase M14 domain-containing protein n=1 Tax=Paramarasmius palmivorus TaxID=297713 RepID=A0AAW0EED6_9AGAR
MHSAIPFGLALAALTLAAPQHPITLPSSPLLYKFNVSSEHRNEFIDIAHSHDLDIWSTSSTVDIYSSNIPDALAGYPYTTSQPPQSLHTTQASIGGPWNLSSLTNSTFHQSYHPLYEIDQFIHQLASEYPHLVNVVHLGHSAEGREMLALRISSTSNTTSSAHTQKKHKHKGKDKPKEDPPKLSILLLGAQHAREWVASATSLYLAHSIISSSAEQHSLSSLLTTYDFYIIPIPNPDGYVYTWESDRFWYKNRQVLRPDAGSNECRGLDMNRNWGYKWKKRGGPDGVRGDAVEGDECTHSYPGHRPFESPEVNNIANYMSTIPNLVAFLNLRAYGQMVSTPFSYSCKRYPPDSEDLFEASLGAISALRSIHATEFTTGRLCETLYAAGGNVADWVYKRVVGAWKGRVKYVYAVHLRDTGTYGFALPAQWIRPVGEETAALVRYLAGFVGGQMGRV